MDELQTWSDVDQYLVSKLAPSDEALDAALRDSNEAGLPQINVAPNQGKLLQLLATMQGAKRILEIGTLGGYSTIWLARALPSDGRLISLELEARHADVARRNLERAGLSSRVEIRVGTATGSLHEMIADNVEPFDFIFIDADKEGYQVYLELSLQLSRPGTVIVADNVVRSGEVANPAATDSRVQGVQKFLDHASNESRIDGTAVQTVGSKGHDGFALFIVRQPIL
jgi:predicted O-methyltransferase YrrM